jgi:hypothetical protein
MLFVQSEIIDIVAVSKKVPDLSPQNPSLKYLTREILENKTRLAILFLNTALIFFLAYLTSLN